MEIFIKRIQNSRGEFCDMPKYMTNGAAAFDLVSNEEVLLKKGEAKAVPTGIAIQLPTRDFVAFVFARSGLSLKQGIALANGVGVIDSDYRGEILVSLRNMSCEDVLIERGLRIAQLCVMPVVVCNLIEKNELSETARGEGGFGSTGVKT